MDPDRERLNIKQACLRAGVSRRTLYNWMDTHKVEWIETVGGGRRIYADSLWKKFPDDGHRA